MTDNFIRSIVIDGFRAFEHFEMRDLGRVNLLVGKNNSGKSSVLEAIQILSAPYGDLSPLWSVLEARGDVVWDEAGKWSQSTADISHLFLGHSVAIGSSFQFEAKHSSALKKIGFEITDYNEQTAERIQGNLKRSLTGREALRSLTVEWGGAGGKTKEFPIVAGHDLVWWPVVNATRLAERAAPPIIVVPTKGLSTEKLGEFFDDIALTPSEDDVITTLKVIDERISRIAKLSTRVITNNSSPNKFMVSLRSVENRVPLGTLGDGIGRLLGLSLAIAKSANGTLLIDEIDTGLHYTVMEKMWKLIYEGAKRLNVQVFATTHSRDCVEALAAIATTNNEDEADVTIQRIEKGKTESIGFRGGEIVIAAERDIEVR